MRNSYDITLLYVEHKSDYKPLKPYLEETFEIGYELKDSQHTTLKDLFDTISSYLALIYELSNTPKDKNKVLLNQNQEEYDKDLALTKANIGFYCIEKTQNKRKGYDLIKDATYQ